MTQDSPYPWREEGATPFIKIAGLSKRFGNITAVDDVILDIFKGELFGLLGGPAAEKPRCCGCWPALKHRPAVLSLLMART